MNPYFVNKYLLLGEQDSKKTVLLLLFALFPFSALFPHAHLCAAAWSVLLFAVGFWVSREKMPSTSQAWLYAAFLALTLSGVVLSAARVASLISFLLRLSFFLPLFYEGMKEKMCRLLSLLGGLIGGVTLLSLIFGGGVTEYSDPSLFPSLSRASGLFGNPNVTAAFLLPPALLSLHALLFAGRGRCFSFLCFFGSLTGIAATYSRGALIALLFAAFLLFACRFGLIPTLFTLLALLPLLLLLLPSGLTARLLSVLSPDTSVFYRFSLWKSIFRLPPRALLFGVGEGKRAMLAALEGVLAGGLLHVEHTHSLFLHILLAEGVVGLLLFLFLCGRALLSNKGLGARAALLSLLIFGIFDDPLYSGQTEVLFWLTLGLC